MKIGLITMHAVDNYGSTLQTYATIRKLEEMGHEVEIIDYRIPVPLSFLKKVLLYPKHIKFAGFRKKHYHHITKEYHSMDELRQDSPIADCYLVGSDMVWNSEITKETAKSFFLDFGEKNVIRAAYAPSFGMLKWEDTEWLQKEEALSLLKQFQFLSVRETFGMDILQNEFGINTATQVVDPTLLFDNYPELTGVIKQTNDLIIYKLLANSPGFYDKAKEVGRLLNNTPRSIGSIRRIKGIKCSYPEGVEEWIRRIGGAKYVITDSFHGTVFSILYHRQFILYEKSPKLTSRMRSILMLLGLEDRIVPNEATPMEIKNKLLEKIDYNKVQSCLTELRKTSNDFLTQISSYGRN